MTTTERPADTIDARLERMEAILTALYERETVKDFYTTYEFGRAVGKAEFTVREWCRLGRINGTKKHTGRGVHPAWTISHDELLRYRRDGLLTRKHPSPRP